MSLRKHAFFIATITMMSMMGLLASDVYIPGLDKLTQALQATPSDIQLTLGLYLLGLSVFQLFYGPISDRYGRKPVLLIGFTLYTFASLACVFSHTIIELIIARFFQGVGACCGLVVGRAVIADKFDREQTIKVYNIVYPLVATSPAIAPFIGGYLTSWFSWRATFVFVTLFGMLLITMTALFLEETNQQRKTADIKLTTIVANMPKMLRHPGFLSYLVCICAVYGAWFTYLAEGTFLFAKMGYHPHQIGYFYFPFVIAIYLGNYLCKRYVGKFGVTRILCLGQMFFITGSLLLLLFVFILPMTNPIEIILPMTINAVANGIILPLAIPSAIALFPKISGSASGFVGFCQIGFSSLCASFVGKLFPISEMSLAAILVTFSLCSLLLYLLFSALE